MNKDKEGKTRKKRKERGGGQPKYSLGVSALGRLKQS
tara:strand:+ start:437 stop:547 length:111 start_codon:yes stop_codon:yes gene_type:complete